MGNSEHIMYMPAIRHGDDYVPFALLAANHGKTINVGYTARMNRRDRNIYVKKSFQEFKQRKLKDDTLYVIRNSYFYPPQSSSRFSWGMLDGYAIIAPKVNGLKKSDLLPWPVSIQIDNDKHSLFSLIKKYMIADHAIFLSIRDEGVKNIPSDFLKIMKNIGSNIHQLKHRGSYASIITNGKLETEEISNKEKVSFKHEVFNHTINIVSAGFHFGDLSRIDIDGIPLSLNRRGFNVIIMKLNDNKVKRYSFDTFEYNNPMMASE